MNCLPLLVQIVSAVFTPVDLLSFTSFCLMVLSSHDLARSNNKLPCTPLALRLLPCIKVLSKPSSFESFLQSIGIYLNTPTPTYEDNQGTIKFVCLTDTICHHAVKTAWLNENFENDQLKLAYTKTTMMLCDCSTKPSNGANLFDQISYVIGQRFYPTPHHQHYHDLDLSDYSYLHCFPKNGLLSSFSDLHSLSSTVEWGWVLETTQL